MLIFLANLFEKACSAFAWVNQFLLLVLGIIFGVLLKGSLDIDGFLGVIIVIGVAIFGLLIAFVINLFYFGFFAQIIAIKKGIEKLLEK